MNLFLHYKEPDVKKVVRQTFLGKARQGARDELFLDVFFIDLNCFSHDDEVPKKLLVEEGRSKEDCKKRYQVSFLDLS